MLDHRGKQRSRGVQMYLGNRKQQGALSLEEEVLQHIQRLGQQLMH